MPATDIGLSLARLNYAVAANCALTLGRALERSLKAGFRPDEPRVPAGNPDGGQWTDEGGLGVAGDFARIIRVGGEEENLEDAEPRNIAGRLFDATPAQAARLDISYAEMQAAVGRVQRIDPTWQPRPSLYETIEGEISANKAAAQEARSKYSELQWQGLAPGQFATESQPAAGPGRNRRADQIRLNNAIGSRSGCHTCGTLDPGTVSGNYFLDHQRPSALIEEGEAQRIFPQCASCSARQGWYVLQLRNRLQQ